VPNIRTKEGDRKKEGRCKGSKGEHIGAEEGRRRGVRERGSEKKDRFTCQKEYWEEKNRRKKGRRRLYSIEGGDGTLSESWGNQPGGTSKKKEEKGAGKCLKGEFCTWNGSRENTVEGGDTRAINPKRKVGEGDIGEPPRRESQLSQKKSPGDTRKRN